MNLTSPARAMRPFVPRTAFCCPMHAFAGGFAMAGFTAPDPNAPPPPPFHDETPQEVSEFCRRTASSAEDLFLRPGKGQRLVIRGGSVLDMAAKTVLPNHDVVIVDGVIVDVAPTSQGIAGDVEVYAGGRFVMPGLSDVHAHPFGVTWAGVMTERAQIAGGAEAFTLPYGLLMLLYMAAGVTRVDVMAGDPDMLALRDLGASGAIHAPTMSVGTPLVDGPVPYHSAKTSWLVADADGARIAVREAVRRGYDFLKPYSLLPHAAYDPLMDAAAAAGLRVMGHIPKETGVEHALARGDHHIAHVGEYFMWLDGPERTDIRRLASLARMTADEGVWVQATVTVMDRFERVLDPAFDPTSLPDFERTHPLCAKLFAPKSPMMESMRQGDSLKAITLNLTETASLMMAKLRDAGARILTGVDAPNPYTVEGFTLHEELRQLVDVHGMSTWEALDASTRLAAEYHNESGRAGVVARGARADLLVLDQNPAEDIKATRSIDTVVVKGAVLSAQARAEGLRRIRQAYAAMPV